MHILICFLLLCYLHRTGFLEHALLHLALVKLEALHPISILNPDAQVHAHLTRGATGCSGVPASLLTSAGAGVPASSDNWLSFYDNLAAFVLAWWTSSPYFPALEITGFLPRKAITL